MLCSMIGHDMKNCLITIDGLLYNKKQKGEWTTDDMDALEQSLKLMHDSIKQFQTVSMVSDPAKFELDNLIAAIKSIHRNDFQKENIAFETHLGSQHVLIEQPYHTIQIIINNLIINAIKALSGLPEKRIALDIDIIEGNCVLNVRDNAPIIEERICRDIFKYGFSTTGGSGIGLFQVKECLKRMGGGISVVNEPDNSLYVKSFSIYFPLNPPSKKDI